MQRWIWENPLGVVANVMDCNLIVSEFELQLFYYIHYRTNTLGKYMNSIVPPTMGQIVPLLFFYKDGFGIK